MVKVLGSVKCFYCGHVSGHISIESTADKKVQRFTPRRGYTGEKPVAGQAIRCERCRGPVFLDEGDKPLNYELPVSIQSAMRRPAAQRPMRKSA